MNKDIKIEYSDILPLQFFKKQVFHGSFKGLRYRIEKVELEEGDKRLQLTTWPEPLSFEATPEEKRTVRIFEYSEDGRKQVIDYLNEIHKNYI